MTDRRQIEVDGRDIDPTAHGRTDYAITCRIHGSGDEQTPIPPDSWIRAALEH